MAAQERIKDLLKRGEKVEDLSLIDVFSRSRLETPVRGKNCTHLSVRPFLLFLPSSLLTWDGMNRHSICIPT